MDAIVIAREIKKKLVEKNMLEVPKSIYESTLFEFLYKYNYDETFIERYKMISRFDVVIRLYQKRIPLVIIISGTLCIG